jgi:GNAT superfamily N-acetyltransferase
MMETMIREITREDAEEVNKLSTQLGYPLTVGQTLQNIEAVISSKDHTAFVAVYENKIVGWIGAAHAIMIEVMPHCEINGLVIDQNYRGKGIGKLLIERVSQWAKGEGINTLSLHCNVNRIEARQFYGHIGFKEIKQQSNLVLDI